MVFLCCFWYISPSHAKNFVLPPKDVDLIGKVHKVKVTIPEDTLLDIARRNGLGLDEIVAANPKVDQWIPAKGNPDIILPNRFILPKAPRTGIVINSPEKRLYYFPPTVDGKAKQVITHPVSVGRVKWKTPIGITKVISKQIDPVWRPPASIRAEAIENGNPLPAVVPAGPNNPLGRFAMRLALGGGGYLIHGTDKPFGIGMQVTHGCMRLYPEDIETLFTEVPVNTQVNIVNQPVKLGWFAMTLFIEVTEPLEQDQQIYTKDKLLQIALDLINAEKQLRSFKIDSVVLMRAITEKTGVPIAISKFEDF
ncbi:hypothetical protein TI05_15140 [Achromatium sp. WMS3]|nr:hypothetical protein TI05_15140 [Achromatium sp. WMS3]